MGIKLNKFDIFFFLIYVIGFVYLFNINAVSLLTFGGLSLIIGAWLVYKGKIFYSMWAYLFADSCWILNAYFNGDLLGTIMVSAGVILSVLATIKMGSGKMERSLRHSD